MHGQQNINKNFVVSKICLFLKIDNFKTLEQIFMKFSTGKIC